MVLLPVYYRGTPHQRRSRSDRSSSFRSSFDLLQAELESIVETLSGKGYDPIPCVQLDLSRPFFAVLCLKIISLL